MITLKIVKQLPGLSIPPSPQSQTFHCLTSMHIIIEKKVQSVMPVKEHMTMERRRQLRMLTKDSISLHHLRKEVRYPTDVSSCLPVYHLA